ncbi:MAG TPA: TrkA C-terminal domain-containing protein [Gaiellaceae bacterium]|nr:TrkA C-terminal domain-containing protein [Gaiellaceae bacterium]
MPLELKETRLPGVGVKWSLATARGSRVTVIQHNDGEREVYVHRRARDEDPAVVLELHDDEARQLGALLGGAYERPRIVEELEMALGEFQIEWIKVPPGSWANGRSLAEVALRKRTGGVTVVAILRESESIAGAQPEDVMLDGDTIVVVGQAGQFAAARKLITSGPDEGQ